MLTGTFWRNWPLDFGGWSNPHRSFIRRSDKGIWERLLTCLIDEPDFEWLMIDVSHRKVHPHAAGAKGFKQDRVAQKGVNLKSHLTVDSHGIPLRAVIIQGKTTDCKQAVALIDGFCAQYLWAGRGYGFNLVTILSKMNKFRDFGLSRTVHPEDGIMDVVIMPGRGF